MSMSMLVAEEHLQDADGMLSIVMATVNAHLDDDMTLAMKEDIFYAIRGVQRLVESVIDHLPADSDITVKNHYPFQTQKEGEASAAC